MRVLGLLLVLANSLYAQTVTLPGPGPIHILGTAITLDATCTGTGSGLTIACSGAMTVTAGDTIACGGYGGVFSPNFLVLVLSADRDQYDHQNSLTFLKNAALVMHYGNSRINLGECTSAL